MRPCFSSPLSELSLNNCDTNWVTQYSSELPRESLSMLRLPVKSIIVQGRVFLVFNREPVNEYQPGRGWMKEEMLRKKRGQGTCCSFVLCREERGCERRGEESNSRQEGAHYQHHKGSAATSCSSAWEWMDRSRETIKCKKGT